jgi:hypothetical protein
MITRRPVTASPLAPPDSLSCDVCRDFVTLTGDAAQRDADEATFTARHRRRHELEEAARAEAEEKAKRTRTKGMKR